MEASAQNACGVPADNRSLGEPEGACNIYKRQFAYREKRNELKRMLAERQAAYIAPSLDIYKQHEADMAELNKQRNDKDDLTSR